MSLVTDTQATALTAVAETVVELMESKGFGEMCTAAHSMGLVMTELAELVEADRKGRAEFMSQKINFTNAEEEVADAIIRLLHYAGQRGMNIGGAVQAKMEYNAQRPHKHGCAY